MLYDHRRKAVATVGDFSHRASLISASLPSYPVTLTKLPVALAERDFHVVRGREEALMRRNQACPDLSETSGIKHTGETNSYVERGSTERLRIPEIA